MDGMGMVSMFLESPFSRRNNSHFWVSASVSFLFGGSGQVSFREFEKVRTATDRWTLKKHKKNTLPVTLPEKNTKSGLVV